jgi:hypothetical protein
MPRLVALLVFLLVSMPAAAVSCVAQESAKQAHSAAQQVFSARVEEIYSAPGFGRDDFHFAKLRVLRTWKGDLSPGDVVDATAEDSINFVSDGFVPVEGSEVLVYTGGGRPYVLSACSRSAPLDRTQDLRILDGLPRPARGGRGR